LVSIVFITANRCQLLLDALATVSDLQAREPYEIIVVDNGSTDETAVQVNRHFPQVRFFQMTENKGVAGGRNIGLEHAQGEVVIFMDDDALLQSDDIFQQVRKRFDENESLAAIAFQIVNDSVDAVLSHEFPMRAHNSENIATEQLVSYFIGCGFAVRRGYFLEAGGFHPDMIYALEEVDLSYRLLELGYDILYCPGVVVRHRTPPAVRRKDAWYFNLMRSRVLMVLKNLPWWAAVPHLLIWHVGLLAYALVNRHMKGYWRGFLAGWRLAPGALAARQPISWSTARRIQRLSGRLFY
jgi:GT2 family glycosyltransferase